LLLLVIHIKVVQIFSFQNFKRFFEEISPTFWFLGKKIELRMWAPRLLKFLNSSNVTIHIINFYETLKFPFLSLINDSCEEEKKKCLWLRDEMIV
jgi:hypothetical protein